MQRKGYFNTAYLAFAADTNSAVFIVIITSCPVIHETKPILGKLADTYLGDTS